MASTSAVGPDETLSSSSGKDNFTRLVRLLICGGTRILREYFDSCKPPANLAAFLRTLTVEQRLQKLKRKRVLSLAQWKVLYPSSTTCGTSESFDITMLLTLIRELVVLTPPASGWDNLPVNGDTSLPADLARIKYYRNTVYAHGSENMELKNEDFDDYWDELEAALLRIVQSYAGKTSIALKKWETAINDLFKSPLSKEIKVNDLFGNPQAELAMESRYFQNSDSRQCLRSAYMEEQISDMTRSEFTRLIRTKSDEKSSKEISIRCILKTATWGAVVAGTTYIFFRYKDDPEELRRMIKEVVLPVGLLVGTIAIGSIQIGLQAESMEALEDLLIRYKSGKLEKDLAKVFMTEELKKVTNGEDIKFRVEMNENDYRIAYCEMMRKVSKRKGKSSALRQLQSIDTQNILLRESLLTWIDGRRKVVKSLRDYANKLNKLKLRVNFARATKLFDALFWPVLVAAGAMLAYCLGAYDGRWIIGAGFFTVFAAVVIILVGVFGAGAFKASLRSFFLTKLYDLKTRRPCPPGTGKNSSFADGYDHVSRQKIEEELRVSQTMDTRREGVRVQIVGESRSVSNVWYADFRHLNDVRSCLEKVKNKVKCLKETERESLRTEYKPVQSSSEFDKVFHKVKEFIEFLALARLDFRAFVESLVENHQGSITEVEKKIQEMAENLEITCRDIDKVHDFAEEYFDELFMCTHDDTLTAERLDENIERLYELYVELFANRREVRKELTKLADALNKREKKINITSFVRRLKEALGTTMMIGAVVASNFTNIGLVRYVFVCFVGFWLRRKSRESEIPMYLLPKTIYQDALQTIDRDQKLTKKLRSCINNLELVLSSIKEDELEELNLILAEELQIAESSTKFESRVLGKKIFYDSVQATKGVKKSFGTGTSKLREHGGFIEKENLALVDIYKFVESSIFLHDCHGSVAEKKIREIVKEFPCLDREEIPAMIKEYIIETLLRK